MNSFCESGVGVDGSVYFICGAFHFEGEAHFCDEFGSVVTDDVSAEEFSVFLSEEELDESFCVS